MLSFFAPLSTWNVVKVEGLSGSLLSRGILDGLSHKSGRSSNLKYRQLFGLSIVHI